MAFLVNYISLVNCISLTTSVFVLGCLTCIYTHALGGECPAATSANTPSARYGGDAPELFPTRQQTAGENRPGTRTASSEAPRPPPRTARCTPKNKETPRSAWRVRILKYIVCLIFPTSHMPGAFPRAGISGEWDNVVLCGICRKSRKSR